MGEATHKVIDKASKTTPITVHNKHMDTRPNKAVAILWHTKIIPVIIIFKISTSNLLGTTYR